MISIVPKIKLTNEAFDNLLPENIKRKSKRFFTPEDVAIQSAKWLSGSDHRVVVDIGAGAGKFCLFGAAHTKSQFIGFEMRPHLVDIASKMFHDFEIKNARVLHGNITDFQFSNFEAFYMYNPFHENMVPFLRMDDTVLLSKDFYGIYIQHTHAQLSLAKSGTRLVTYHGNNFEVPGSYEKVNEFFGGNLNYWIKQDK
jgi:hypothetical protein